MEQAINALVPDSGDIQSTHELLWQNDIAPQIDTERESVYCIDQGGDGILTLYSLSMYTFEVKWTATVDGVLSELRELALKDGKLYIPSNTIVQFDIESQSVDWSTYTPGDLTGEVAVANGYVYGCCSATENYSIFRIDTATGNINYESGIASQPSGPIIYDGSAIVTGGGYLQSFNASDGQKEWEESLGLTVGPPTYYGGRIYCRVGSRLSVITADTGNIAWELSGDTAGETQEMVAVHNDVAYTVYPSESPTVFKAIDIWDEIVIRTGDLSDIDYFPTPVYLTINDETLYLIGAVNTPDGVSAHVHAYDAISGDKQWDTVGLEMDPYSDITSFPNADWQFTERAGRLEEIPGTVS